MSLYNMLNGTNSISQKLLALLKLTEGDFGRYRDTYVSGNYIVVHTRCGGGNREDYEDMFDEVSNHPWYSHDEDSDFDNTYADIYFAIPDDETRSLIALIGTGQTPDEKWNNAFAALGITR